MSSLLSSMQSAANALGAYERVLQVTQNNVANASTTDYAKQTQTLYAMPFDPATGPTGGVRAGELVSTRDQYAEQAVWEQNSLLGKATQDVNSLTSLQTNFDVSGESGISVALNNLYSAFSAWGQTPNDATSRQTVINQATAVANAFQQTASGLAKIERTSEQQIQQTVTQVNDLTSQLQGYNQQIMSGDRGDAGLDAEVYASLEQLSQYVSITATKQTDGSVTVLMNGQTPLVIGDRQYKLSYDLEQPTSPTPTYTDAPALAHIYSAGGDDVTSTISSGQLGSLLDLRNTTLPSYTGDAYQQGSLNILAQNFADCVNALLTAGNITDAVANSDGTTTPAVTGVPLFTYSTNSDGTAVATAVAASLSVNSDITASQLAAIDPGPPEVANGVPLALANLANPQQAADEINGASYTEYYASMASTVGDGLSTATNEQQVRQSSLAQAQNLRQQMSGVSLDAEAMTLVEFQRAYEANSRLITVLNQLTEDTINILST